MTIPSIEAHWLIEFIEVFALGITLGVIVTSIIFTRRSVTRLKQTLASVATQLIENEQLIQQLTQYMEKLEQHK
jgi:hypothetical protein